LVEILCPCVVEGGQRTIAAPEKKSLQLLFHYNIHARVVTVLKTAFFDESLAVWVIENYKVITRIGERSPLSQSICLLTCSRKNDFAGLNTDTEIRHRGCPCHADNGFSRDGHVLSGALRKLYKPQVLYIQSNKNDRPNKEDRELLSDF
jgi:hypothetical protein